MKSRGFRAPSFFGKAAFPVAFPGNAAFLGKSSAWCRIARRPGAGWQNGLQVKKMFQKVKNNFERAVYRSDRSQAVLHVNQGVLHTCFLICHHNFCCGQ